MKYEIVSKLNLLLNDFNFFAASNDNGKFLLSARKCRRPTCTDYIITLTPMATPKAKTVYIGKLR